MLTGSSPHGSSPASFCRIRPSSSQAGCWPCPVLANNRVISFSSIQLCKHATRLLWSLGQVCCPWNSLDAKGKWSTPTASSVLIVSEVWITAESEAEFLPLLSLVSESLQQNGRGPHLLWRVICFIQSLSIYMLISSKTTYLDWYLTPNWVS